MGDEEVIHSIMLHVRGGGNAMATIARLLEHLKLRAIDMQTEDFFSLPAAKESFGEWKAYRDRLASSGEGNDG